MLARMSSRADITPAARYGLNRLVVFLSALSLSTLYTSALLFLSEEVAFSRGFERPTCDSLDLVWRNRSSIYSASTGQWVCIQIVGDTHLFSSIMARGPDF